MQNEQIIILGVGKCIADAFRGIVRRALNAVTEAIHNVSLISERVFVVQKNSLMIILFVFDSKIKFHYRLCDRSKIL